MLDINDITLRFSGRLLFNAASAHISDGQKVGLTGRNGTGKTTLFRLILGHLTPDDGEINITKGQKIATVDQEISNIDISLIDFVLQADIQRTALLNELEKAEHENDGMKMADIHEKLNMINANSAQARAGAILYGLGFSSEQQKQPLSSFSGGWRMRVALAAALFVPSDILLLDEPTNHLDLEATLWLEGFLEKYPGTLIIISHDRYLLNRLCTRILHIENLKIHSYGGNYDAFEQTRALQRENERKQAEKTERTSILDGVPKDLPSLMAAYKLQHKAAKVGFDWPDIDPVWDKLEEELRELEEAIVDGQKEKIEEELGDVLFTIVNISRFLKIDPEVALAGTNRKFRRRFSYIEEKVKAKQQNWESLSLIDLDELWQEAKLQDEK